jgi:hypothetical protein
MPELDWDKIMKAAVKALTGQGTVELVKKATGTEQPKGIVTPVKSAYGPTSYDEPIHLNRSAVRMNETFGRSGGDAHQEPEVPDNFTYMDPAPMEGAKDPEASLTPETRKVLEDWRAKERERQRVENLRKALTSGN